MPTLQYPLQALQVEVIALLAADAEAVDSAPVEHHFGEKFKAGSHAPPRYVWIPTRTREQRATTQRAVDEPRALYSTAEYIEIHCWGSTFAQAFALRNNVLRALKQAAAQIRIENAEWVRPSAAWNQAGELYVLEISTSVATFDQYTDPHTGVYPAENTVVLESVDGEIELTSDLATAGDIQITASAEEP